MTLGLTTRKSEFPVIARCTNQRGAPANNETALFIGLVAGNVLACRRYHKHCAHVNEHRYTDDDSDAEKEGSRVPRYGT